MEEEEEVEAAVAAVAPLPVRLRGVATVSCALDFEQAGDAAAVVAWGAVTPAWDAAAPSMGHGATVHAGEEGEEGEEAEEAPVGGGGGGANEAKSGGDAGGKGGGKGGGKAGRGSRLLEHLPPPMMEALRAARLVYERPAPPAADLAGLARLAAAAPHAPHDRLRLGVLRALSGRDAGLLLWQAPAPQPQPQPAAAPPAPAPASAPAPAPAPAPASAPASAPAPPPPAAPVVPTCLAGARCHSKYKALAIQLLPWQALSAVARSPLAVAAARRGELCKAQQPAARTSEHRRLVGGRRRLAELNHLPEVTP